MQGSGQKNESAGGGEMRNRVPIYRDELTEGNLHIKQKKDLHKK
jgi:hypothetical protein